MLSSKRFWLGLLVSGLFLALFLYGIDYPRTGEALQGANYIYVLPAIAVYFGSLFFRTYRWQFLLRHLRPLSMARLYPVVVIGYMANNVLPVRLGEVARSYYLSKQENVSATSTLATVGVERVFDGLTLMFFVLVVWPFLPLGDFFKDDAGAIELVRTIGGAVVMVMFVVAIVLFVAVTTYPTLGRRLTTLLLVFVPGRFKDTVRMLCEQFIRGLESLNSPGRLFIIFVLSIPIWMMESVMYYLITLSFDLDASFALIMLTTATSNLIGAIPNTSGGIGTFEWATKVTLVSFGIQTEPAVAYAAALHVVLWLPVVIAGLVYLWTHHGSLVEILRQRPVAELADGPAVQAASLKGDSEK